MLNIDFPKVVYIYVIIVVIMYVSVIQGNIVPDVSRYTDRRDEMADENLVLETDYSTEKYTKDYLTYFVQNYDSMDDEKFRNFFDDDYYNVYFSELKKALNAKVKIKNKKDNYSYIDIVRKDVLEDGRRVCIYNVIVMKKGLFYPEGYNILTKEKSIDKNKSIDIWVIENAPYNYELQIPGKEFIPD